VAPEALEKLPPGQLVHTAAVGDVEPGGPKDPGEQGVPRQLNAPVPVMYVPPTQAVQVAAVAMVAKEGPDVPEGQGVPVQTVEPCTEVYVPLGQEGQDGAFVPPGEKLPGRHHWQTVSSVKRQRADANWPFGQVRHPRQ